MRQLSLPSDEEAGEPELLSQGGLCLPDPLALFCFPISYQVFADLLDFCLLYSGE